MGIDQPKVDVVMTVYNSEKYIGEAIDSLLNQQLVPIRIIIVNDGSTDDTMNIIKKRCEGYDWIVVISQENKGIEDAANRGIEECGAEYIARLDADDICDPFRLANQVSYLDAHPTCVAVDGKHWEIDSSGRRIAFHDPREGPVSFDALSYPAKEPYLTHTFLVVRRWAIMEVGKYRYATYSEDADLYWRLINKGELHHSGDVLGMYRRHTDSVSSKSILNGRISAINSQLAAVSFKRRERGDADLAFDPTAKSLYDAANSIDAIVKIAARQLNTVERRWFETAVGAKLLELCIYRSYIPDTTDAIYIGSQVRKIPWKSTKTPVKNVLKLSRKLLKAGEWRIAVALISALIFRTS